MIEGFINPFTREERWYEAEFDLNLKPITRGFAVRVQVTRKRPHWEVIRVSAEPDIQAERFARPIDEIVEVTPFEVLSDHGPAVLVRRHIDDALPGRALDGGEWPELVDTPDEGVSVAREALPVVYDAETFWDLFTHLDGRPELAGLSLLQDADRMGIPPGMRLDPEGVAGLRSVLETLTPAQVRAFHEGLVYFLYQADRPKYQGQVPPPRAQDLRDDPTVLRRVGLLADGPVAVREVDLHDVVLSPTEEDAAREILDIAGDVLNEGPSRNWATVFDPFTGANPSWGVSAEPDKDSYETFVYDPEPWGPFVVNPSLLLWDGKTAYGLRLFVRTSSGFEELTLLVRESTRRRAAQQALSFLPSLVGPIGPSDVRSGEIYDSRWTSVGDQTVAFARSLRKPYESADAFDVP